MWPVTDRFLQTVRASHIEVWEAEARRIDLDAPGLPLEVLPGGRITFNLDDTIRASGTLRVIDPTGALTPDVARDVLSTTTTEIHLASGLIYPDGEDELVPLGVFKVTDRQVDDTDGAGPIYELTLLDRSGRLQDPLQRAYAIAGGSPVEDAIRGLLLSIIPTLQMRLANTGFTTPPLVVRPDSDPWEEARNLARSAGYDLHFDRVGVLVMAPVTLAAARRPAYIYDATLHADFWDVEFHESSDRIPNEVVIIGTNSSLTSPVSGSAADLDPHSATYIGDPAYGRKTMTDRDPYVRSSDQAAASAAARLGRELGPGDEVSFDATPNAALDPADTLAVNRPEAGLDHRRMLLSELELHTDPGSAARVTARRSILTSNEDLTARSVA